MRLPVCRIDIQSDLLCPSCQEKLEKGEIDQFDIEFSRWLIDKTNTYPSLEQIDLRRAMRVGSRLLLIVKKKNKDVITSIDGFLEDAEETYGEVLVIESPVKLRTLVRMLIHPSIEVGVNSLYLPDGMKESIVILKGTDRDRIPYSKTDLREIVSAVIGESVLFEYDDESTEKTEDETEDSYGKKLREYGKRRH